MSKSHSPHAKQEQRYQLKQAKKYQRAVQNNRRSAETDVLFKTLRTEASQEDCLIAMVMKISRIFKDMPPSVVTPIIMLATLAFLISQANAQEVPSETHNLSNSVSTGRVSIDASSYTASQAELAVASFASSSVVPRQVAFTHKWAHVLTVSDELRKVITADEVLFYQQEVCEAIDKVYTKSDRNKKHLDYAFATHLKMELNPEEPENPDHYQYEGLRHRIKIAIPYGKGSIKGAMAGRNPFVERLINLLMHEVQHANTAIANSNEACDPVLEFNKVIQGLRERAPLIPSNPDKVLEKVQIGQEYVLAHVAKLLPIKEDYVDVTARYTLHESARFFKKKHKDFNGDDAKKELAYLQHLLKDYQPNRQRVAGFSAAQVKEVIKQLKKNEPYSFMHPEGNFKIYVDHIEERHGQFYASGYLVKNPKDKVRAFVEDTRWNKNRMPQVYAKIFAQSSFPQGKLASESEAHVYQTNDLAVMEKIYSELFKLSEKNQAASRCQPIVNRP